MPSNLTIDDIVGITYERAGGMVFNPRDIATNQPVKLTDLGQKSLEAFWRMKK